MKVFEADWRSRQWLPGKNLRLKLDDDRASTAKKVAKSIARDLPPVGPWWRRS